MPGQTYSFGTVKAAQARGDFEVLAERAGGRCGSIWVRRCGGSRPRLADAVDRALAEAARHDK